VQGQGFCRKVQRMEQVWEGLYPEIFEKVRLLCCFEKGV